MDTRTPLCIRYEYEQDKDCRVKYAHGVWGGINPFGEVEINFYLESDKLPDYTECHVEPDGLPGSELMPGNRETRVVVRNIHSRVVMNYQTAKAMLEWLEEKVEALESEVESPGSYFDGRSGMEQ